LHEASSGTGSPPAFLLRREAAAFSVPSKSTTLPLTPRSGSVQADFYKHEFVRPAAF
jgi:hypothetical protein